MLAATVAEALLAFESSGAGGSILAASVAEALAAADLAAGDRIFLVVAGDTIAAAEVVDGVVSAKPIDAAPSHTFKLTGASRSYVLVSGPKGVRTWKLR